MRARVCVCVCACACMCVREKESVCLCEYVIFKHVTSKGTQGTKIERNEHMKKERMKWEKNKERKKR